MNFFAAFRADYTNQKNLVWPTMLFLLALTVVGFGASREGQSLAVRIAVIVCLIAFIGGVGYAFSYDSLTKAGAGTNKLKAVKGGIKYAAEILSLFGMLGAVTTIALYATSIDQSLHDVAINATQEPAKTLSLLKDIPSLFIGIFVLTFASAAAGRKIALARYEFKFP